MATGGSLGLMARTHKGVVLFVAALFVFSLVLFASSAAVPRPALAAAGDPVVTLQDNTHECEGVLPNGGSENTDKRLIDGDLVPGGSATFEISYPVTADDVAGRTTFEIRDCVFIDGEAALKYVVTFVPNTENFILTFTLQIPDGTPIGAKYCNYAKTVAAPSKSPASNRKAGPACFVVGGNISILKTNEAGQPLAGAHFHIVCTLPTVDAGTFLPTTIIDGVPHDSHSGDVITQNVVTDSTGRIAIQAPEGTSCVITETQAPDGYDLPADPSVTLKATAGGVHHTFVDPKAFVPAPGLSVSKGVSLDAAGPFTASLTATIGQTVYYRITITNTGNVPLTGVTLADTIFQDAVDACDVPDTLAVGKDFVCNYTSTAVVGTTENTATGDSEETGPDSDTATVTVGTGSLKIIKDIPNVPAGFTGSFGVHVTCTGGLTFDRTIAFPDPGSVTIDGIPAGSVCVVIETSRSDPPAGFQWAGSIISDPVTIAADQTATATVTNGLITLQGTPVLSVLKANNAPVPPSGAKEGDTVTYTLLYAVSDGPVDNGVITDKLPAGVTYVAGSASSDAQFTFVDFNVTTPGALTWKATSVATAGTLTYKVTINAGAAGIAQPLTNTACIDSDDTESVCADSDVFVAPPVLAETSVPTAPRTDVLDASGSSSPGMNLGFVLLIIGALAFAVLFVTPMPASTRNRIRRR